MNLKTLAILSFFTVTTIFANAQGVTGCGYKIPPRSLRTNFASIL
jgi:hypothetical protein